MDVQFLANIAVEKVKTFVNEKTKAISDQLKQFEEKFSHIEEKFSDFADKKSVEEISSSLQGGLNRIEEFTKTFPIPENGKDGANGKDAPELEEIVKSLEPKLEELVKAIPPAKDGDPGAPGKDADPVDLEELVKNVTLAVIEAAKAETDMMKDQIKTIVDGVYSDLMKILTDDLLAKIEEKFAEIPAPENGKDAVVDYDEIHKSIITSMDFDQKIKGYIDAIPPAKDGKDADPVNVQEIIDSSIELLVPVIEEKSAAIEIKLSEKIAEKVAEIPAPKDGVAGKDAEPVNIQEIVNLAVEKIAPLADSTIEEKFASIPLPKDGIDGKDAEPVNLEELKSAVMVDITLQVDTYVLKAMGEHRDYIDQVMKAIPAPENGKDGISPAIEDVVKAVEPVLAQMVEALPKAVDGQDGKDADVEAIINTVKAGIIIPEIDQEVIAKTVEELVKKEFEQIPVAKDGKDGKDGKDVDFEAVKDMIEEQFKKVELPEDGRDGRDGRDAIEIDILSMIDKEKSYARGTYAHHKGGLWHAFKTTKGMDGWECFVAGTNEISVDYDGERQITVKTIKSDGVAEEKSIKLPIVIDRGVYTPEKSYSEGDGVTYGGSYWIAQKDNPEGKPGAENSGFRLAVKRGRDAKEQVKI